MAVLDQQCYALSWNWWIWWCVDTFKSLHICKSCRSVEIWSKVTWNSFAIGDRWQFSVLCHTLVAAIQLVALFVDGTHDTFIHSSGNSFSSFSTQIVAITQQLQCFSQSFPTVFQKLARQLTNTISFIVFQPCFLPLIRSRKPPRCIITSYSAILAYKWSYDDAIRYYTISSSNDLTLVREKIAFTMILYCALYSTSRKTFVCRWHDTVHLS